MQDWQPDPGIIGLMALHILEGERPLFFYGLSYSGALTAYVMAALFRLFGTSFFTFTLTPILFAVALVLVVYFFFRELLGRRAGLLAALCVAVADGVTAWYGAVPDCSYNPLLPLGTMVLLLALRINRLPLEARGLWVHTLLLGLTAGLAVWTHPMAGVYLVCAICFLVPFLIRHRLRPGTLAPFAAGALVFAVFLTPYLSGHDEAWRLSAKWNLHATALQTHAKMLYQRALPPFLAWPVPWKSAATVGAMAGLLVLLVVYLLAVLVERDPERRRSSLFPLLFAFVFLLFYLPHRMAAEATSRYLLPAWTLVLPGLFAVAVTAPRSAVRFAGSGLLGLWLLAQAAGTVHAVAAARPRSLQKRLALERLVARGREAGAQHVVMLGPRGFADHGAVCSFLARDEPRFVAAAGEPYQRASQLADAEPDPAFAGLTAPFTRFTNSLAAIGARWERLDDPVAPLAFRIDLPAATRRSIPPSNLAVSAVAPAGGRAEHLLDRSKDSVLLGRCRLGSGFLVTLDEPRRVDGLYLAPVGRLDDGLPSAYRLEGSKDGHTFFILRTVASGMPFVYEVAGRPYAGGAYGWLACRFPPADLRALRFTALPEPGRADLWYASEVFVLEHLGERAADWVKARDEIVGVVRAAGTTFTYADRWVSTAFYPDGWSRGPAAAYPTSQGRRIRGGIRPPFLVRTIEPRAGEAIVVETTFADECEALLAAARGTASPWLRREGGAYTAFLLPAGADGDGARLWWNGFMPLLMP